MQWCFRKGFRADERLVNLWSSGSDDRSGFLKTPRIRFGGGLANPVRTAERPSLAAKGESVGRETSADVPLTGLSF